MTYLCITKIPIEHFRSIWVKGEEEKMRKALYVLILVGMVASLSLIGESEAAPIRVKLIVPWPKHFIENDLNWGWIDAVNKKAKGEMIVEHIGGSEVIRGMDQVEGVRSGAVDIYVGTHAYYLAAAPEGDASKLWTGMTGAELRTAGIYDLMDKIHQERVNAKLLGLMATPMNFQFYSNVPVKSPAEMKGVKIRVSPYYLDFIKALGAVPTVIAPPEIYTSLERGTVDGMCWPTVGIAKYGWAPKLKYIVGPPFYIYTGFWLMNLQKWNSIPKHLQEVMTEAMIEQVEKGSVPHYKKLQDEERDKLLKQGLKVIEFSPEDSKRYVALARSSAWDALMKRSPKYGPQLKEMVEKEMAKR
jgi:TRAP-type C4-dicarboxylate transport system substrate-binding protein